MRCVILMNDIGDVPGMQCVHGLSVYVETAHHRLLVDAGQDDRTWENAATLGIDLSSVDTLIVSHGHYDHSGGVMSFAQKNPQAAIYLNELAGRDYWNMRGEAHYIGIDKAILALPQTRLLPGDVVTELDPEICIFGGVTGRRLWPEGNRILTRRTEDGFVQDTFDHEQYVVVRDAGRSVLIGGCAHNGMLNILDRYHELFGDYPNAVVSGFHMMKNEPYNEVEIATIRETAEELRKLPVLYFTGHCTSLPAYDIMKPILGEQLVYFGSGEEILARADLT